MPHASGHALNDRWQSHSTVPQSHHVHRACLRAELGEEAADEADDGKRKDDERLARREGNDGKCQEDEGGDTQPDLDGDVLDGGGDDDRARKGS